MECPFCQFKEMDLYDEDMDNAFYQCPLCYYIVNITKEDKHELQR
jgi:hypothetical protein